jgi:hypothetical protein
VTPDPDRSRWIGRAAGIYALATLAGVVYLLVVWRGR